MATILHFTIFELQRWGSCCISCQEVCIYYGGFFGECLCKVEYRLYPILWAVYTDPQLHMQKLDFLQKLDSILIYLQINFGTSRIILSGDFNIDLMHRNDRHVRNSLLSINESFNLYPLALRPTRVSATSETLIDNISTNNYYNRLNVSCTVCASISDHFLVLVVFTKEVNKA